MKQLKTSFATSQPFTPTFNLNLFPSSLEYCWQAELKNNIILHPYQPAKSQLFTFGAEYPDSFLSFGHPRARGSFASWLVRCATTGDHEIWNINVWHHVCFAFNSSNSHVVFVQVSPSQQV